MEYINIAFTGHRPNRLYGYDLNNPRYKQLSEILKDRRFFSAEQEEAIHKAAAEEIKKYLKNESADELNEELNQVLKDLD